VALPVQNTNFNFVDYLFQSATAEEKERLLQQEPSVDIDKVKESWGKFKEDLNKMATVKQEIFKESMPERVKELSARHEKLIHENELLRKAHPNICWRRFLSVSLLVSALAAGIIGAAVGCVVTAVIGFSIAAVACVPVLLNYTKEASDLVDEQIAREE
jgi:hypothetical protein